MIAFDEKNSRLCYAYDGESLTVEPWGENSFRVRATRQGAFPETDWALLPPQPCPVTAEIAPEGARMTNGKLTAELSSSGCLKFWKDGNHCVLEEFWRTRKDKNFCSSLLVDGREFKPHSGGDHQLTVRFESRAGEKLYGMGQYQQPELNLKGCDLELAQRNSQASVPFVVSSLGYGFLWNNPAIGRVVFGKNLTTWQAYSTKAMDYWVTAGDTPVELVESYGKATGTVPMMPDFAMGFWQCKLRYRTQEEVLRVAREYKRRNLPVSVLVIDYFHWTNQGDWKFDLKYWPDPEGMVRELEEMGIKVMVSVWPYVDWKSENYQDMLEKGYLVRTERGVRMTFDVRGNTVAFDPTNPDARKYVWNIVKKNYYEEGIKLFWLDEAEPEYTVYDFDHYRYYAGPTLQTGNCYPLVYAKAFYDGLREQGEEVVNLLRCAWAGSQRYGALVWSGDIHSSFKSMRFQISAGLNMGMAGIPWWTTDIGGFAGGDPEDPEFRELLVRWFEYGTFCPVMRLHGKREPLSPPMSQEGGGLCPTGADNEVWSFGEEALKILSRYLWVREGLRDYIRGLMEEAHRKGTPVMRPLFYMYPKDPDAWEVEDSYLFGPDILVAPVTQKGQTEKDVYLPAGAVWTDAWTGKAYQGGQTVSVKTPLEQIPLFTRGEFRLRLGLD